MAMTFSEAKNVIVPFGLYAGKTVDATASTDAGLRWLDWINGEGIRSPRLKEAVSVYLADPTIAKELGKALEDGHG